MMKRKIKLVKNFTQTSLKSVKRYLAKYWEYLVILIALYLLKDYYFYNNELRLAEKETQPWKWPIYHHSLSKTLLGNDRKSRAKPIKTDLLKNKQPSKLKKLIVYSLPAFDEEIPYPIDSNKCGGECEVSYNSSLFGVAHAVIFHIYDLRPIPPRKFPNQIYVWNNQESPSTTLHAYRMPFKQYENTFNFTMTYRRDSDIYFPYNTTQNVLQSMKSSNEFDDLKQLLESKSYLAAWVCGNYKTKGGGWRMRIVLRMILSGFDVDIYGYSVFNPIAGHWWDLPNHLSPYKFYLSFENSFHCKDYITEKVWWNAFQAGVVPVIWGPTKQDAAALLPLGSYILAEDFDTVSDLVKYLNYLDQNDDEYLKYFQWRKTILSKTISGRKTELSGSDADITGFCQLCKQLYDDDRQERMNGKRPRHVVASIQQWWYLTENEECLSPRTVVETFSDRYYRHLLLLEIWLCFYTYKLYYAISLCVLILFMLYRRRNT